jgi:hypothetical protein
MDVAPLKCPHCGAPLDVPSPCPGTRTCVYCGHVSLLAPEDIGKGAIIDDGPERFPGKPRIEVDGARFVLVGRLAQGESSDVYLGCTDRRLGERVVIKLLRAPGDADLLRSEWRVAQELSKSEAQGGAYFSTLVPQPVRHGVAGHVDGSRLASVFRFRPGFVYTLSDVGRAHPSGVAPAAGMWMWKRLLEVLGWTHRAGFAHGAVLPQHVLVHPRDHGVALVGWTCAARLDGRAPLAARVATSRAIYPHEAAAGARSVPRHLARCRRRWPTSCARAREWNWERASTPGLSRMK